MSDSPKYKNMRLREETHRQLAEIQDRLHLATLDDAVQHLLDPHTVRVTPETHAELTRIAGHINGTEADAVAFVVQPNIVRVCLAPDQRKRWMQYAKGNGQSLQDWIMTRVEAAILHGVDPGIHRRVHDMVTALVRAAGIIPTQTHAPTDRQIITDETPRRP